MNSKKIFNRRAWVFLLAIFILEAGTVEAKKTSEGKAKLKALNEKLVAYGAEGKLPEAIKTAEDALQLAAKEYGPKEIETAKAMNNLANLYMYAGKTNEAVGLYQRAILIEIVKTGQDSTEVADTYFNLGLAYSSQGNYNEARQMLNRSLLIRSEKLGPNHPETQKVHKIFSQIWETEHPHAKALS